MTSTATPPTVPRGALRHASQGWHFLASATAVCNDTTPARTNRHHHHHQPQNTMDMDMDNNDPYGLPPGIAPMVSLPRLTASDTPAHVRNYATQAYVAVKSILMALRHQQAQRQSLEQEVARATGRLLEMAATHLTHPTHARYPPTLAYAPAHPPARPPTFA